MSSTSPSIGRQLRRLSILGSGTALLAASLALLSFQLHEVRSSLLRRLETVAEVIAFNSAPAVDFNDVDAATTMLGSLKTRPEVLAAGIVVKGRLFAIYHNSHTRASEGELTHTPQTGFQFTSRELTVFRPISAQGRLLGTVFVRSDLSEIEQTWRRFAVVTGAVTIPALFIAILISQLLQRSISRPILNLASIAAVVSQEKDFSVRAPTERSAAEIELLVGTFNQMLAEIQRQHGEIQEAHDTLEERVADRTGELEVRTRQLEAQERELTSANRELESFSYSVSHDLRAPLRAIDGFSKALLTNYGGTLDQQGRHFLDRVRAGTEKMSSLIDDMLHLARVTRSALNRRDVDVTAVARDVALELARRNPERSVRFVIEPGLRASADSNLLTIAFENLIGNAWKFTGSREDAQVDVGRISKEGHTVFFVHDNGAGFDMTYADKLFGPFQRLHHESEFEGTGIGLATVKRIITRHGGLVWATALPGQGATFFFTLGDTL